MNCTYIERILPLYAGGDLGCKGERVVAAHLRSCASCGLLAEGYRRSQEILSSYEAPEFSVAFFDGIRSAVLEEYAGTASPRLTLVQRARNFLGESLPDAGLLSPRVAGFAGLSLAIVLGLTFFIAQSGRQANESANANSTLPGVGAKGGRQSPVRQTTLSGSIPDEKPAVQSLETGEARHIDRAIIAAVPSGKRRRIVPPAVRRTGAPERPLKQYKAEVVPGEETYLEAISKLDKVISQRDGIISSTLRAEYERNLTDVNRAIADTRKAALKHRNNPQMTDFVFAAYRGKVMLLSEMAKQSQVTASEF